jgi:hypothetical protein
MDLQDSQWYSCSARNHFGEYTSSGFIDVVNEYPVDPTLMAAHEERKTLVSASVGAGILLICLLIMCASVALVFRRRAKVFFCSKLQPLHGIMDNVIGGQIFKSVE